MPIAALGWKTSAGYLLMFALGSAGTWLIHSRESSADTEAARRAPRSSSRASSVTSGPEGMLARLNAQKPKPAAAPQDLDAQCLKRIAALRKSMRPAEDPASAAKAAMEGEPVCRPNFPGEMEETLEGRAEVAVRFIQWLEADPDAAIACASGKYMTRFSGPEMALRLWITEIPKDDAFSRLQSVSAGGSMNASPLMRGLFDEATTSGDIGALEKIIKFDPRGQLLGYATLDGGWPDLALRSWPKDKLDELESYAMSSKNPYLILTLMDRGGPAEGAARIQALVNSGQNQAVVQSIGADSLSRKVVENTAMPLDQRIELINRLASASGKTQPDPNRAKNLIVGNEYSKLRGSGTLESLNYSLTSGAMDIQGFRDAFAAAMPDASTLDPKAVRDLATAAMISADPLRNSALISELPAGTGGGEQAVLSGSLNLPPEKFNELQTSLATDAEMSRPKNVLNRWQNYFSNRWSGLLEREWVENLPPGLNRDAALSGLAQSIEPIDPRGAGALRLKITNPAALK